MEFEVSQVQGQQRFRFTAEKNEAKELLSRYDHIYPHFLIEEAVSGEIGMPVSLNRMMLVFRNNFSEVVELTTNLDATPRGNKEFDSYVSVVCVVRSIWPAGEGDDGRYTRELRRLMFPIATDPEYFENLRFSLDVNEQDPENLEETVSAYFQGLQLENED